MQLPRLVPDTDVPQRANNVPVPRQRVSARQRTQTMAADAGADDRLADNKRRVAADQKLLARQTYRQVFELIDADDSGTIDASEILKVMKLVSKSADRLKFWDNYRNIGFDRESDGV